ncbi:acyltransferase [Alloacidobacterium dinghuense]|uniref:Acyltransferase n=1 Tax=Alloacidobacterium dinghuense TaxID=2763107 RepID=A0A7G8BPS5_9BACT|nr:acyltransferase [Alloacidobacterium dinghuense]QNI34545.1 acyltransferase [Alloacidobacterium dinghuense]
MDTSKNARIPTLDGWRGIAILLVLIDHVQHSCFRATRYETFSYLGQHGVTIFFVLSGYLITSKLLSELNTTDTIDLGKFYRRRFFRLMPSAWLYLSIVTLVCIVLHSDNFGVIPALFFFRNYVGHNLLTGHFWTLSIEEQFYLVWPAILLLLRRKAWTVAVLGCIIVCLWRIADWNILLSEHVAYSFLTQYRADAILFGCLLALMIVRLKKMLRAWMLWPLLLAFVACIGSYHKFIPTRESIVIALILAVTSTRPDSVLSRPLNAKWLVSLGQMSYSLYIWQEFSLIQFGGHWYIALPTLLTIIFVLGYLNYYFIEQPLNRLGHSLLEAHDCPTPPPSCSKSIVECGRDARLRSIG